MNSISVPLLHGGGRNETDTAAAAAPSSGKSIGNIDPRRKPKWNYFPLVCATMASMTSVLLGYDIGVMSGAIIYIKDQFGISDVKVEILVGLLNIYSLFGSIIAGRVSDMIGRRYTIVVAATVFFVGSLVMGFATSYAFIMIGRVFAGLGVGFGNMIAPVYTSELAPATSRGFLASFPEVFINVGILLGYVSNYSFSKLPVHIGWRFMLGIGVVPSVLLAVMGIFMPESPRWLVIQGRLADAKCVLLKTCSTTDEAQLRLNDIKEAAGIPEHCQDDVVRVATEKSSGKGVWKELIIHPTRAVRHILMCALGIHFIQQAVGLDAVILYSPRIFEKVGLTGDNEKLLATVAVGVMKTIFVIVAAFLIDRAGRRPLLLGSLVGLITSQSILGMSVTLIEHNPTRKIKWAVGLCVSAVLSSVAFFSIGLGPISQVYSAEIFPLRLRAQGLSLGVGMNRIVSGIITMTFLSLYKAITIGGVFFLFAGFATIGLILIYLFYPETQGKTLEEMEGLFGSFINVRDANLNKTEKIMGISSMWGKIRGTALE